VWNQKYRWIATVSVALIMLIAALSVTMKAAYGQESTLPKYETVTVNQDSLGPFSVSYWRNLVSANETTLLTFSDLQVKNLKFFINIDASCEYFYINQTPGRSELIIKNGWLHIGNATVTVDYLYQKATLNGDIIEAKLQIVDMTLPDGAVIDHLDLFMKIPMEDEEN